MNRDVFMSVEKMLSTGYVLDPDYYGEIRGTLCGSCDDGVIQFEDSLTLIDLMYDEDNDEVMRDMAGWTFMSLQNHLLAQFAYGPDERAEFALKVLRHFLSKNPDKYALSSVYMALYLSKERTFDWSDTATKKLQEARSLFNSFCADIWAGGVWVNNYSNGKLALVSTTMQEPLFTKNDWVLGKYMISRRIEEENIRSLKFPKFEIIPISCFVNKEEIYDLLDYKLSTRMAVFTEQRKYFLI